MGERPPSIREVVLRSWVRSQDKRDINALHSAPSVAPDELHCIRQRNTRLRSAAQAAMLRTGYSLENANAMLLLCDDKGVVMDATGDSSILSLGSENHLHPGGSWAENAIGTNAIGTALYLGKPVTIRGVEHFCEAIQRWSCAAAPLHDPLSGRILGAVNISGPSHETMRRAPALAGTLALQIEESLRSATLQEHARLIDALLSRRNRLAGDDVVLLNRHGWKIWASRGGGKLSERLEHHRMELHRATMVNDGNGPELAELIGEILPGAEIEILNERNEALGLIVALNERRPRSMKLSGPAIDLRQISSSGETMRHLCVTAKKVVAGGVPLLLEGPDGCGKETLARALHADGPLAALPFEILNCGLLDAATLRSGLTGHDALLRLAEQGGTLCLDEPAQTPPEAQPLLSQILAQLDRTGAAVQVISLSTDTLGEQMEAGVLQSHLHYRLLGGALRIPGLADRREDLPELIRRFASLYACTDRGGPLRFTPAAMMHLKLYDWRGNLRELRNLVETLGVTSRSGLIDTADLPRHIGRTPDRERSQPTLRDREKAEILRAIAQSDGNMTSVARQLGIARSTLYIKLDQHGIPRLRRG